MGANQSKPAGKELKAANILDILATKYILTQNFQDMQKLGHPEYCNKLVILTGNIIKKFLKEREIEYAAQRIEDGIPVNTKKKKSVIYLSQRKLKKQQKKDKDTPQHKKRIYNPDGSYREVTQSGVYPAQDSKKSEKTLLSELDVKNPQEKDSMCKGIAKFYIKIGHIFAAILKAVNPIYKYGEHEMSIMNKSKIPPGTKVVLSEKNLCNRRIKTLKVKSTESGILNVSVNNCKLNKSTTTKKLDDNILDNLDLDYGAEVIKNKTLGVEIGIPELEKLYFDVYDFGRGKFTSKTKSSEKEYRKDLKTFYETFTGKKDYKTWNSSGNKKFSDIPLAAYHEKKICTDSDSAWKQTYEGKEDNPLFKKFADNVKTMLQNTNENQKKLLGILDKLFVWVDSPAKFKAVDDKLENKVVTINPKLTNDSLQKIVVETRKLIIAIYLGCEKDYQIGLNLFEAIVGERILKNSIAKKAQLEKQLDSVVVGEDKDGLGNIVKQNIDTALSNPMENVKIPKAAATGGGGRRKRRSRKKYR